jgi:rhomboid family GlyGly-CTERM serine protease
MQSLLQFFQASEHSRTTIRAFARRPHFCPGWDGSLLLALVVGFNLHLAGIGTAGWKIFLPSAFADGQWWRLMTYPFVHVSWYHLLLDAGAFFLLYAEMNDMKISHKWFCLMSCTFSSLAAALVAAPQVESIGLGGLSGTAHGLMAFSGLEMMCKASGRRTGWLVFLLVSVKSVWEAFTGEVIFGFMHMGACGTPQAVCHLGGVIGGTVAYWLLKDGGSAQFYPSPSSITRGIEMC